MSTKFSDSLVKRYQDYMLTRYGFVVEREAALRDLERLADLHALLSPS